MFLDAVSSKSIAKRDCQSTLLTLIGDVAGGGANPLLPAAPHIGVGFNDLQLMHVRWRA